MVPQHKETGKRKKKRLNRIRGWGRGGKKGGLLNCKMGHDGGGILFCLFEDGVNFVFANYAQCVCIKVFFFFARASDNYSHRGPRCLKSSSSVLFEVDVFPNAPLPRVHVYTADGEA